MRSRYNKGFAAKYLLQVPLTLVTAIAVAHLPGATLASSSPRVQPYWSMNLPVDGGSLAAPHIPAPYHSLANYYVSKSGSDNGSGTATAPWLTISHAIAVLKAKGSEQGGVCVNVLPGTYHESVDAGSLSGSGATANRLFVLRSTVPHAAVIQIPRNTSDYSDGIRFTNAKYIVIDGFTIRGHIVTTGNRDESGIDTSGTSASTCLSHHITVINNIIYNVGGSGIASQHADYWKVQGNVVYNSCNTSIWGVSAINDWHPVALDSDKGFHIIVASNISHDNEEVHINAQHWDGNGITFDDFNATQTSDNGIKPYVESSLVESNLCYCNGGAGFLTGGGGSSYVTVCNNTMFDNYLDIRNTATLRGDICIMNSHNMTLVNNLSVANPNVDLHNCAFVDSGAGDTNNIWSHNLAFNGSAGDRAIDFVNTPSTIRQSNGNILGEDPLFRDPRRGDFQLTKNSPALRSAKRLHGIPRLPLSEKPVNPSSWDIGAY